MESKITTLDGDVLLTNMRRMGNSTRQVDSAIQILFNGDTCVVMDHCSGGKDENSNWDLLGRIMKRLSLEHPYVKFRVVDGVTPEINLKKN